MTRFLLLAAWFFGLTGCQLVAVDVSHVRTDKGYLNSGLKGLGQVYVYDTATDFIEFLDVVPLPATVRGRTFVRQAASVLDGYELVGALDSQTQAAIEAEIAGNSEILLEGATRVSAQNTITALAAYINAGAAAHDYGRTWLLDEASAPGSTLRFAIVRAAIVADTAAITHRGSASAGGEIDVPTGWMGRTTVELRGLSSEQFEGSQVPVFVEYYLFRAFRNTNGNYDFELDRAASKDLWQQRLKRR